MNSRAYLGMALLAVAGLLPAGCQDKNPDPVKLPPATVEVALPIPRDNVTDYQIFTARTQAEQSVDLKARVTGYLVNITYDDGTMVKGPLAFWALAAKKTADSETPFWELLARRVASDSIDELGQVLFEIDNSIYKASLDKAKADLQFAEASLAKAQAIYDTGLATQKLDKTAISVAKLAEQKGGRDQAAASINQAKAEVELAQQNFDWCKVRAPISGLASRHLVDKGNNVSQNVTVLCNIVSLRPTWAYFNVDQNTALNYQEMVKNGKAPSILQDKVEVKMALGMDPLFNIDGFIDYKSNQLDPNTGSIQIRATFPNKDGKLSAGLFARIKVPTGMPHKALLVNDQAVGTQQNKRFVLVVTDQDVVKYREVKVGEVHEGLREVYSTFDVLTVDAKGNPITKPEVVLQATDRVIVSGLQRVRPEAKVKPVLVDMQTLMAVKEK